MEYPGGGEGDALEPKDIGQAHQHAREEDPLIQNRGHYDSYEYDDRLGFIRKVYGILAA